MDDALYERAQMSKHYLGRHDQRNHGRDDHKKLSSKKEALGRDLYDIEDAFGDESPEWKEKSDEWRKVSAELAGFEDAIAGIAGLTATGAGVGHFLNAPSSQTRRVAQQLERIGDTSEMVTDITSGNRSRRARRRGGAAGAALGALIALGVARQNRVIRDQNKDD